MKRGHGFTIAGLILVLSAIGVLSAIVTIGWNGAVTSWQNYARANEVKQWEAAFDSYKNRFGA